MRRPPLWGNFVAYADSDLLAFARLYTGGLHVLGYYHAIQAIEKYLKALALSIIDPTGNSETPETNRWLLNHNLVRLANRCGSKYPYYKEPKSLKLLERFSEFDQSTRYPWVLQKLGNGFTSADIPLIWDLLFHLRTDIPIEKDDYMLGMAVRGYHQNHPEIPTNLLQNPGLADSVAALQAVFPDIRKLVRL